MSNLPRPLLHQVLQISLLEKYFKNTIIYNPRSQVNLSIQDLNVIKFSHSNAIFLNKYINDYIIPEPVSTPGSERMPSPKKSREQPVKQIQKFVSRPKPYVFIDNHDVIESLLMILLS